MQSRPCWKASSKVSAEYSAHLVSLSLSPYFCWIFSPISVSISRCVLVGAHIDPTLRSNPPSSKMPRSKPKLTRAVSQAKKSSNFFMAFFCSFKPR